MQALTAAVEPHPDHARDGAADAADLQRQRPGAALPRWAGRQQVGQAVGQPGQHPCGAATNAGSMIVGSCSPVYAIADFAHRISMNRRRMEHAKG